MTYILNHMKKFRYGLYRALSAKLSVGFIFKQRGAVSLRNRTGEMVNVCT